LRRSLLGRSDQSIDQHSRSEKAADELQDALVGHPFGHQPHQDVVVDPVERRHARLPITKTMQIRSSSLVNGMYLKGAGSSSSGAS
jgi:hypothetical protein